MNFAARCSLCGERHKDAVIPGYTHLRRAQPVLWPHYILAYFEMFERDRERFTQARARINVMPLGSGALAGSGFPLDRAAIAEDLGFDAITRNSMDVSADRDFALDFLYACASVTCCISAAWPKIGFSTRAKSSDGWNWAMA